MNFEEYKSILEKKYSKHFDILQNYEYNDTIFDLCAAYKERNERYFGSKKAVIDVIENYEYCFIKHYENIDQEKIEGFINILKDAFGEYIKPNNEHMSTYITGIIVVDTIENNQIIDTIKKFKYSKSFLFTLKGWAKIRLILVDLNNYKVYCNKEGDKVRKIYEVQ